MAGTERWTALAEVRAGVVMAVPLVFGYVPLALVIGAAETDHRAGAAGWSSSGLINAGSAHLTAIGRLDTSGALMPSALPCSSRPRLLL